IRLVRKKYYQSLLQQFSQKDLVYSKMQDFRYFWSLETTKLGVIHYHVHLIPRFDEKEINLVFKNNASLMFPQDYEKVQNTSLNAKVTKDSVKVAVADNKVTVIPA
ncbi:hypothetical protein ACMUE1_00065, partial [Candidatus Phytoplasma asteris]